MAASPPSKIPPHLEPDLYQKHLEGWSDSRIAGWLDKEHGVPATRIDVFRARGRYVKRYAEGEVAGPKPQARPERPPPSVEPLVGELITAERAAEDKAARGAGEIVALPSPDATDEDLLRHWRNSLSRGAHAAEAAKDEPLKLAHLHVLTKIIDTARKLKKDRLDAERAGRGEQGGPPVKGYLTVSPEDWPEAPAPAEPKAAVN